MIVRALIVLFAMIATPLAAAEMRGDRVALVIGNAKYPDAEAPLSEPINDALDIAGELKRNGFDVEIGENLTSDAMRRAFDRLYDRVKSGGAALIFYSGYGIQSARQSYLIPVDAQIWTEPDVRRDGVSLEAVLGELNSRGAGVKIALIDAARRNPFERRFRSFSAGLAPVVAPIGSLVMYSAALSSVTSDSGGTHSLFVSELLKQIHAPDRTLDETLDRTRAAVIRASRNEQVPWISSSLADVVSFGPMPKADTPDQAAAEPAPPAAAAPDATAPATTTPAIADDATINQLTRRIADNPDDGSALYRRGQVYASKGAYDLALGDFNETLRLNPKDVEALNNRCWVRAVTGDLTGALKDCNEALRLRPNFVDALDSRGLLNLKNGQSRNAIADFDAALKINPQLTSSLYGRGLAKQQAGQTDAGAIDIANAKAMDPNIVGEFEGYGVR